MQIKLAADNATILWRDEESSKRGSIQPTHDLTGYAQEIQDFAAQVWTAAFIDQWRAEHYPEPTLDELKERKINELSKACRAHIFTGFDSDALGTTHHYPAKQGSEQFDQTNLIAAYARAKGDQTKTYKLICADSNGVWARRPHTADQTIQVSEEGYDFVEAARDRLYEVLIPQVEAATTKTELDSITW